MTQYTSMQPQGQVLNPLSASQAVGATPVIGQGKQTEQFVSEIHGQYYIANYFGGVFSANVTAVTVPVIASGLVSVFSLYNPLASGVNMELIDFDFAMVLATTVVDAVGLYYSAANLAAAGTFTTVGTPQSGLIGSGASPRGKFYSAYTHSGTPVRCAILGSFGATTNVGGVSSENLNGKIIIPPGTVVSVAMSTAAGTASGLDIGCTWAEWLI